MKRDAEYLRQIVLEMEDSESNVVVLRNYIGMRGEHLKRWHHFELLCDAGLVRRVSDSGFRLTADGHDFAEAVRDPGRWRKMQEWMSTTGASWTMDGLKLLALELLRQSLTGG